MLKKINEEQFGRVYEIMDNSLPIEEHRPYENQLALLKREEYSIFAIEDSNNITGFMAVWQFEQFAFIEHLAVDDKFRNRSLGSKALSEISKIIKIPIILEVEPPTEEIRGRRIEFYKRNGFFLNEYKYLQPPLYNGAPIIDLMLMSSGAELSEEKFNQYREILYKNVYGCSVGEYI